MLEAQPKPAGGDVEVMQVSRTHGRRAPVGAIGRLRLFTCGLFATGLLVGVTTLASGDGGPRVPVRAAASPVDAGAHGGGPVLDAVRVPVTALASHGIKSPRTLPYGDAGLVAVTALVALGMFVAARRTDRPGNVAPEHLPGRRAPPHNPSPR